jgi:hypothetical protein
LERPNLARESRNTVQTSEPDKVPGLARSGKWGAFPGHGYRLSAPALADIAAILKAAEKRQGRPARTRLKGLIAASLRRIARARR